jgi:hypothetical protein
MTGDTLLSIQNPAKLFTFKDYKSEYHKLSMQFHSDHGADPQFFEWKKNFPMSIQDNTNVENTWQGKIKYGGWDNGEYKQMMERIHLDLRSNGLTWNKNNASIALTHSDQFNSSPVWNAKYISIGPTRNDVKKQNLN